MEGEIWTRASLRCILKEMGGAKAKISFRATGNEVAGHQGLREQPGLEPRICYGPECWLAFRSHDSLELP